MAVSTLLFYHGYNKSPTNLPTLDITTDKSKKGAKSGQNRLKNGQKWLMAHRFTKDLICKTMDYNVTQNQIGGSHTAQAHQYNPVLSGSQALKRH